MSMNSRPTARPRLPWQVQAVLALAAIELVFYSQTVAFNNDEGFHLLAASLVGAGKVPYRDFFYQHPPLFPYLYEAWMRLTGETWRSAHLLSALLTTATIWLVVNYVVSRQSAARAATGMVVVLLFCCNRQFVQSGTVGHPYALCMFLSVLAFCLLARGIGSDRRRSSFQAGVAGGGAVLSSFLVAPLLPALAAWVLFGKGVRHRFGQTAAFLAGAAVWLGPLVWFIVQAPRAVLFDLFEYQMFYRGPVYRIPPSGAFVEGLRTLTLWAFSWDRLLATLLAIIGIWLLLLRRTVEPAHRAGVGPAAGVAAALALFACTPHPTFPVYFVVVTPFLCMLAGHGLSSLARAGWTPRLPARPLVIIAALLAVGVMKPAYNVVHRVFNSVSYWTSVELIADAVDRVAPRNAAVCVPEAVYFVAHRLPPAGLENWYAPVVSLSSSRASSLRIVPQSQIDEWIRSGRFAAVWMAADDPRIDSLPLSRVYDKRITVRSIVRGGFDPDGYGYLFWKGGAEPIAEQ